MALSVADLRFTLVGRVALYKAYPKYGVGKFSNQVAKNSKFQ